MKVWIVLRYTGYEDVNIVGVFNRSHKAHDYAKEQKKKKEYFTSYNVERWEIDNSRND